MASEQKWSARWMRFGVVVMLILATIGAWEVVKMVRLANPAHADGLVADHLACYDVKSRSGVIDAKALVQLRDQFFVTGVEAEVRQLRLLCTAAVKTLLP
jgi:hypothetical protein